MDAFIKNLLIEFSSNRISKEELATRFLIDCENISNKLRNLVEQAIESKDSNNIEILLPAMISVENDYEFTDILHILILEPWHTRYEDIIHYLQARKNPNSVKIIKKAIQNKYDFLESYGTGTGQFISQCGYALFSIGTDEAFETIRELSMSQDSIIKVEMEYQLERIQKSSSSDEPKAKKRWWN